MTTISLRVPDLLHKAVRELAKQEGSSINVLVGRAAAIGRRTTHSRNKHFRSGHYCYSSGRHD